jgi:hypothetical protein
MTDVKIIISSDDKGDQLVNFAQQTAITLVKNSLTRSQIRNILLRFVRSNLFGRGTKKRKQ